MSSGNYDITYYTDIESKQVDWLWYPYIPYGKLTILQGDPGDGKTTFILSIMALMSKNECLPFSEQRISGISIYQNAEDDISDTIKPRLEQHKANCKNICFIDSKGSPLSMDEVISKEPFKKQVQSSWFLIPFSPSSETMWI